MNNQHNNEIDKKNENKKWLNRNVLGMGLASFFSDASHEMATTILPGFLSVIGAPPTALGLIEGISDAVSSFIKLWAGWISDKFGKRKILSSAGYLLTGFSQAIFAFALNWYLVLFGRLIGWFGRGFRGPIRDAMLSDSIESTERGKAFGFHRASDTIGAIIGPVIGILLLNIWQPLSLENNSLPFRKIFLITLIPGILSFLVFWFFVKDKKGNPLKVDSKFWITVKGLPNSFKKYLISVGIFGLGDFAPTFFILATTTLLTPEYGLNKAAQIAGVLYVIRNISYALASYPVGAISDKIKRNYVLSGGYLIAFLTVSGFILAFVFNITSFLFLLVLFILAGIYIAAEDTLESAITADLIPSNTRGTAMGILGTVNGVGDFVSSFLIGLIWTAFSPVFGFFISAIFMIVGTIIMLLIKIEKNG